MLSSGDIAWWLLAVVLTMAIAGCFYRVSPAEIQYMWESSADLSPDWSADGKTVIGYADRHIYGADADGGRFWPITKPGTGSQYESALSSSGLLATLAQGSNRSGRSCHGAPVREIQQIPLMTVRWPLSGHPVLGFQAGKSGVSRRRWSSAKSPRPIPHLHRPVSSSLGPSIGLANTGWVLIVRFREAVNNRFVNVPELSLGEFRDSLV